MADETRGEVLHAAIDEHPDQATNYMVLADWLQEAGDPRGELIVLSKDTGEDAKVREARRAVLERELGPAALPYGWQRWFYGYVQSVRGIVDEDDTDVVEAYLAHESLRHATALDFQLGGYEDDRQWLVTTLVAKPRPALRNLTLNAYRRGGNEPPDGELDLGPVWDVLPRVASMTVTARYVVVGALRSTTLTSLEIDGSVPVDELTPLLGGSCPALRELVLHDVGASFRGMLDRSPLAKQLTKVSLTVADRDRYEQTGE